MKTNLKRRLLSMTLAVVMISTLFSFGALTVSATTYTTAADLTGTFTINANGTDNGTLKVYASQDTAITAKSTDGSDTFVIPLTAIDANSVAIWKMLKATDKITFTEGVVTAIEIVDTAAAFEPAATINLSEVDVKLTTDKAHNLSAIVATTVKSIDVNYVVATNELKLPKTLGTLTISAVPTGNDKITPATSGTIDTLDIAVDLAADVTIGAAGGLVPVTAKNITISEDQSGGNGITLPKIETAVGTLTIKNDAAIDLTKIAGKGASDDLSKFDTLVIDSPVATGTLGTQLENITYKNIVFKTAPVGALTLPAAMTFDKVTIADDIGAATLLVFPNGITVKEIEIDANVKLDLSNVKAGAAAANDIVKIVVGENSANSEIEIPTKAKAANTNIDLSALKTDADKLKVTYAADEKVTYTLANSGEVVADEWNSTKTTGLFASSNAGTAEVDGGAGAYSYEFTVGTKMPSTATTNLASNNKDVSITGNTEGVTSITVTVSYTDSDDATLASATVKGKAATLGTAITTEPTAAPTGANLGSVSFPITVAEGEDITEFEANDERAEVISAKIVTAAAIAGSNWTAAYAAGVAITDDGEDQYADGDYIIVTVEAEDGTENYYAIQITIVTQATKFSVEIDYVNEVLIVAGTDGDLQDGDIMYALKVKDFGDSLKKAKYFPLIGETEDEDGNITYQLDISKYIPKKPGKDYQIHIKGRQGLGLTVEAAPANQDQVKLAGRPVGKTDVNKTNLVYANEKLSYTGSKNIQVRFGDSKEYINMNNSTLKDLDYSMDFFPSGVTLYARVAPATGATPNFASLEVKIAVKAPAKAPVITFDNDKLKGAKATNQVLIKTAEKPEGEWVTIPDTKATKEAFIKFLTDKKIDVSLYGTPDATTGNIVILTRDFKNNISSAKGELLIKASEVVAPAGELTNVTIAAATGAGSTGKVKFTALPTPTGTNTLVYKVTTTEVKSVKVTDKVTDGTAANTTDTITAAKDSYVTVYEINDSSEVVKFVSKKVEATGTGS